MFKNSILIRVHHSLKQILTPASERKLRIMIGFSIIIAIFDVFSIGGLIYLFRFLLNTNNSFSPLLIITLAFIILLFFIFKNALSLFLNKKQAYFAFKEATTQSKSILKSIYMQNELFFRDAETGALLSDIMYVPAAFANGIIMGYMTLWSELVVILLMLFLLAATSFSVSILCFLLIAPTAFFSYKNIRKRIETLGDRRNNSVKQAQDILIQGIHGRTDGLLYNRLNYFEDTFEMYQRRISNTDATVSLMNSLPPRIMELFAVSAFALIYLLTNYLGNGADYALVLTLFVAAAFRLLPSVNRSLGAVLKIKNHWFTIDTLIRYTNNETDKSLIPMNFYATLKIENLEFSFNNKQICKVPLFELNKGSCIGIYGATGEGKSTFLQLLMQLIPATRGDFFVDENNVNKNHAYHQLFAYVKQDVFIMNKSLQENISFCDEKLCNRERVNTIIKRLGLGKIEHLFNFADSAGEGGNKLSGGQKKLVALARAAYFDSPIWILDEPLASMDAELLKFILVFLKEEQKKGKTIVLVAHHKPIFDICDLVYEFKAGKLILSN